MFFHFRLQNHQTNNYRHIFTVAVDLLFVGLQNFCNIRPNDFFFPVALTIFIFGSVHICLGENRSPISHLKKYGGVPSNIHLNDFENLFHKFS